MTPTRTARPLTICADCGDPISVEELDDAWRDPNNFSVFHAGCDDRTHDLRRCTCPACDEDRNDR